MSSFSPDTPDPEGIEAEGNELAGIVAANLHRLRLERGLSLEKLAQLSGVSRAMLGQIEQARCSPSINLLWRVVTALGTPFSAILHRPETSTTRILRSADAKRLLSGSGEFSSRALFPFDQRRRVEFYELRLAPYSLEHSEAHPPGATENLVLVQGRLIVGVAGQSLELQCGDSVFFAGDLPHSYNNPHEEEALFYLVMSYVENVG